MLFHFLNYHILELRFDRRCLRVRKGISELELLFILFKNPLILFLPKYMEIPFNTTQS